MRIKQENKGENFSAENANYAGRSDGTRIESKNLNQKSMIQSFQTCTTNMHIRQLTITHIS